MATSSLKRPRKRPSGARIPVSSRSYARLTVVILIGIVVFAALFILDTQALLQLFWMTLRGGFGSGARLLAAVLAMVLLLPLCLAAWRVIFPRSVPPRPAPGRKAQRPRKAKAKSPVVAARKKSLEPST